MLTRESLQSGLYLETLEIPLEYRWTQRRIDESLARTIAARPAALSDASDGHDALWIFAYGSLLWNPLLDFDRRELATLHGWHRSFCLRTLAGRGSTERPGRMLGLEPGGNTQGAVLRLAGDRRDNELRVVWTREMIAGTYRPIWTGITLADGTDAHAIAFVADASHPLYERDASVATAAPIIARATGSLGSNAEYLFRLEAALSAGGMRDAYIESLAATLRRPAGEVA